MRHAQLRSPSFFSSPLLVILCGNERTRPRTSQVVGWLVDIRPCLRSVTSLRPLRRVTSYLPLAIHHRMTLTVSLQTHTSFGQAKRDANTYLCSIRVVGPVIACRSFGQYPEAQISDKSGGILEMCTPTVSGRPLKREMVTKHIGVKISILAGAAHGCSYEGHQHITYWRRPGYVVIDKQTLNAVSTQSALWIQRLAWFQGLRGIISSCFLCFNIAIFATTIRILTGQLVRLCSMWYTIHGSFQNIVYPRLQYSLP